MEQKPPADAPEVEEVSQAISIFTGKASGMARIGRRTVARGTGSTSRPPSTSSAVAWTSIPNRPERRYPRKTRKDLHLIPLQSSHLTRPIVLYSSSRLSTPSSLGRGRGEPIARMGRPSTRSLVVPVLPQPLPARFRGATETPGDRPAKRPARNG
jgi:hypothetical protein